MRQFGVTLSRLGGSFVFYSLVAAVYFSSFLPHLSSAFFGPPEDNLQDFWNSWYAAVGHTSGADFFFTNTIKFPEGTTLYYHSFAYPEGFLVWLGTQVFGTGLTTLTWLHNTVLLLSFPVAGVGAFFLARHLTRDTWSALLGGYIFAFNPSHVQHAMHHLHVASIEFIPFFVLAYWQAIEKKSVAWLVSAVLFFALSALSCWYYLFYCGYFVVLHTIFTCIQNRTLPRGWDLYTPLATTGGVIVVLSPLLIPMVREAAAGSNVYASGHDVFVADFFAYISFPPHHILSALTRPLYELFSGNPWEATVYLGIANVGLAVWLFLNRQKLDRRTVAYLAAGIAVFAVIASGSHLRFLGSKLIPMPDLLISNVPLLKNARVPSRTIVFVYLFFAVAVSIAVQALTQKIKDMAMLKRIALVGMLLFIVADFYPAHLDITPFSCSPGLAAIRDDPEKGFGVLNLPDGYVAGNAAMAEQVCHQRPIVQGVTSRDVARTLRDMLETKDLEKQHRQLIDAKIKYIVLRGIDNEIYQWRTQDGVRGDYSLVYRPVYQSDDLSILRVY